MAKIPLRMPMLPKETPTPIPIFRPVLSFVALSAIEVVVDCEEDEEAEGILEVGRLAGNGSDRVGRVVLVIRSLL
jgi:hypothetical protein